MENWSGFEVASLPTKSVATACAVWLPVCSAPTLALQLPDASAVTGSRWAPSIDTRTVAPASAVPVTVTSPRRLAPLAGPVKTGLAVLVLIRTLIGAEVPLVPPGGKVTKALKVCVPSASGASGEQHAAAADAVAEQSGVPPSMTVTVEPGGAP